MEVRLVLCQMNGITFTKDIAVGYIQKWIEEN